MSTTDAERSRRPVDVTTPEIIDKIHEMVMDDRRVKVRQIANAVGISNERVHHILHKPQAIIFIDYIEKGKTIISEYYSSLLDCLKTKLQEKHPRMVHKKVLFHHDNAPAHASIVV